VILCTCSQTRTSWPVAALWNSLHGPDVGEIISCPMSGHWFGQLWNCSPQLC
jgi:hypothetical protein